MSKTKQSKRVQNIYRKKAAEKPNSISNVTSHISLSDNYILLGYFTLRYAELPKVIMRYVKFS